MLTHRRREKHRARLVAAAGRRPGGSGGGRAGFTPQPIPEEFARRQGQVSPQTLAQIKQFVQNGGTVIAIAGSAMGAVQQFELPPPIT